jgi:hypothetical protein
VVLDQASKGEDNLVARSAVIMSPKLKEELMRQLARLPEEKQRRVLAFARGIEPAVGGGFPGKDLLKFSGAMDQADVRAIAKAIEEDCERVDRSGW